MDHQGFPVSDGNFKTQFSKLDRTALKPISFDMASLPYGWISPLEAQILYNLPHVSEGPIIEVGTWIGRSTCALAHGMRASANKHVLDVFDLGWAWAPDTSPPEVVEAMKKPNGVPALLMQHLHERDLRTAINVVAFCDFKKAAIARRYSTAFCDAAHFKWEIDENVPPLMEMMDPENYLIVFDDLWSLEACDYVAQMTGAEKVVCLGGEADEGKSKFGIIAHGSYAKLPWFI
jgi:hypothetical protein